MLSNERKKLKINKQKSQGNIFSEYLIKMTYIIK